jgi:hypothetical protein
MMYLSGLFKHKDYGAMTNNTLPVPQVSNNRRNALLLVMDKGGSVVQNFNKMRFDINKFSLQVAKTGVFTDFYTAGCSNIELNSQPERPILNIADRMTDTSLGGCVVAKFNEEYFQKALNLLKESDGFKFFAAPAEYPDRLNRKLRSEPYTCGNNKLLFAGENN